MQKIRFRPIAALLLCLHLAGCYTWKPLPLSPNDLSPNEFIERESPREVRAWHDSRGLIVLRRARIVGDSIAAFVVETHPESSRTMTTPRNIAVSDLAGFEYRKAMVMSTIGVAVLVPIVVAYAFYSLVVLADCDEIFDTTCGW